jgi:hypothetical protein
MGLVQLSSIQKDMVLTCHRDAADLCALGYSGMSATIVSCTRGRHDLSSSAVRYRVILPTGGAPAV